MTLQRDTPGRSLFDTPLDILVLMGGISAEREVSLASGEAVARALESRGHRIRRADISPQDLSALAGEEPDVVFIAMHGAFGEDGQVQRHCEQRGLTYVGSPPKACELAMDKAASKQIYRRLGLSTPDWAIIEELAPPDRQRADLERIGLPCVIKPVDNGSSVDIHIARDKPTRRDAMEELLDRYGRAMVERYAEGREFTVGIVDSEALPVMEIRTERDFYDYFAKYDDDGTQYIADHRLGREKVAQLQEAALSAHGGLGCRDMSRSDFILGADGTIWILETNTIPGFTDHSLLPKAAAEAGLSFAQLCEELVAMARQRKHFERIRREA